MKNLLSISKGPVVGLEASIVCQLIAIFLKLFIFVGVVSSLSSNPSQERVNFMISHWNDINGQFERLMLSNRGPHPCKIVDIEDSDHNIADDCTGGLSSLVNLVMTKTPEIQPQNEIRLTPGNFVSVDDGWLSVLITKGSDLTGFGKLVQDHLKPHAMTLGVEDLSYGWGKAIDILDLTDSAVPVVISNVDMIKNSTVELQRRVQRCADEFQIIDLKKNNGGNFPVALVGFVEPSVQEFLYPQNSIKLKPVISSLKSAISNAKQSLKLSDLNTFIAIGNCDLELCKKIIDQLPEIKVVVSGISTYLGMFGTQQQADYPLKYKQGLIVNAGRFGSSVGKLLITLDASSGDIISTNGTLLANLRRVPEEVNTTSSINKIKEQVELLSNDEIGKSEFGIKGGPSCLKDSCNLGNIIADSMARCVNRDQMEKDLHYKKRNKPILAIWHAGSITKSDHSVSHYDVIREIDIHKWIPYLESGKLARVEGVILENILKASASASEHNDRFGWFLHVSSNMRVQYSKIDSKGQVDLKSILITYDDPEKNISHEFRSIDYNEVYSVVLPRKIIEGVGPYSFMLAALGNKTVEIMPFSVNTTCLINYIKREQILSWGFERRIVFQENEGILNSLLSNHTFIFSILILIILETILVAYLCCTKRVANKYHSFGWCLREGSDHEILVEESYSEDYSSQANNSEFHLKDLNLNRDLLNVN